MRLALAMALCSCSASLLPATTAANEVRTREIPVTTKAGRSVPVCPWKDLRFSASMKARTFKPGQPVVLRSIVTNGDTVTCSVVIGYYHGYDPSQVVVNHAGRFVWDACDLDDKAGACADLWVMKNLGSGDSYVLTSSWDQRWGQDASGTGQVATGRYRFDSSYTDLIGSVLHNVSAGVAFSIR
jgi:hypothetical protein